MAIKTILVPTDGSEHAKKAVELAADITSRYDARIVILHVLLRHMSAPQLRALCGGIPASVSVMKELEEIETRMLGTVGTPYGPVSLPVPQSLMKKIGDEISEAARKSAEAMGVKDIAVQVVDGSPAECIVAAAEHEKAEMIVMGSRGLSNIGGLLMGSVSHKVSHVAACTCVTVK